MPCSKENSIPIEMIRAILTKQKLTRDSTLNWKVYGPDPVPASPRRLAQTLFFGVCDFPKGLVGADVHPRRCMAKTDASCKK